MAYVPMSYTTGNWTVNEGATVTPTTTYGSGTKTVTVTNWNYGADMSFARATKDGNGYIFHGTTNVDTEQNRAVTIKVEPITDVYRKCTGTKDPVFRTVRKLKVCAGVQILVKYDALDKCSNSVSAEEGDLYFGGHSVFCIQNHPAVTSAYVAHHLGHYIGTLIETDKTALADLILAIMRGDLDPTR